ncbi:macrophage migration inhibitory factor homolog [Metopolophium dirhodum]|uniref:macrophage migration inhibitory factor homolog n=1 Tax=Metopolophium dirhodum TaxID=44670 RepID=UPI00298F7A85|nr:macrophage migration inhibitory factor homolog [Metopolophium dirhodum]XP_060867632.1 macrophage migration inhibitory factor homolog [Metopolophium dirhodum]XP_060867633.1 macrophage migration inhibitory factor homolog [Metopolophium dirhodum]
MPHFRLETNVSKSKVTPELLKKLSAAVAKTLGKPESYVVVTIVPDQLMTWGGDDKPCGTATLMSIGCLGVEQNKKHAAVLYPLLKKELGIPDDRLYITFSDQSSSNVGYTGTTFQTILG